MIMEEMANIFAESVKQNKFKYQLAFKQFSINKSNMMKLSIKLNYLLL